MQRLQYVDLPTKLVYMKFKIKDTAKRNHYCKYKTRILCACKTIIVNEEDERYTQYIGKKSNCSNHKCRSRIKTHHSAQKEFGSGAVMVCSYGDQNDVALFRELGLEEIVAIGLDGRMTEVAGDYSGLKPKQARAKIIEDLESNGFVEKIEEIFIEHQFQREAKIQLK